MKKSLVLLTLLLVPFSLTSMGKPDGKNGKKEEPEYIPLQANQGIYSGIITDGPERSYVTKLSFAGETELDKIKKESDNSTNRIKLAEIASIIIIDPVHTSKRYPEQEFCNVTLITTEGVHVPHLLFPRHLLLCAQERRSHIEKSWHLNMIDRIDIHHNVAENNKQKHTVHTVHVR